MTDSQPNDPTGIDEQASEEQSPWVVAGVFAALGFEFVGFIVGGLLVGAYIDKSFGTGPWGVLVMVLLGLVGVLVHIYHVAKRFLD
ncbi:MAG: AtpZ/AtpI family protein [Persicimonas sp.]